jgi:hypothetical protein
MTDGNTYTTTLDGFFFDANNSPLSPRYLLQLLVAHRLNTTTKRWPGAKITLHNGARIIEKTWPADD